MLIDFQRKIYSYAGAPTANFDDSDSAGIGYRFKEGDWLKDTSASPAIIYQCLSNLTASAVWIKKFSAEDKISLDSLSNNISEADRTIYVNTVTGNNNWDGSSATYVNDNIGPKASISGTNGAGSLIKSVQAHHLFIRFKGIEIVDETSEALYLAPVLANNAKVIITGEDDGFEIIEGPYNVSEASDFTLTTTDTTGWTIDKWAGAYVQCLDTDGNDLGGWVKTIQYLDISPDKKITLSHKLSDYTLVKKFNIVRPKAKIIFNGSPELNSWFLRPVGCGASIPKSYGNLWWYPLPADSSAFVIQHLTIETQNGAYGMAVDGASAKIVFAGIYCANSSNVLSNGLYAFNSMSISLQSNFYSVTTGKEVIDQHHMGVSLAVNNNEHVYWENLSDLRIRGGVLGNFGAQGNTPFKIYNSTISEVTEGARTALLCGRVSLNRIGTYQQPGAGYVNPPVYMGACVYEDCVVKYFGKILMGGNNWDANASLYNSSLYYSGDPNTMYTTTQRYAFNLFISLRRGGKLFFNTTGPTITLTSAFGGPIVFDYDGITYGIFYTWAQVQANRQTVDYEINAGFFDINGTPAFGGY